MPISLIVAQLLIEMHCTSSIRKYKAGGVGIKASALQSVDGGSIPLPRLTKDFTK